MGLTTTEFFARHTEAGGTVLRTKEDRSCVFLDERGCGVHPDRPLACRIYPLARWVDPDGKIVERHLHHTKPHPVGGVRVVSQGLRISEKQELLMALLKSQTVEQ